MPSIFQDETWIVEQAITHICWGLRSGAADFGETRSAIRAWLRDSHRKPPGADKQQRDRVERFMMRLKSVYGENPNQLEMHPVLWTWFAMSEVKDAVDPSFASKFERWTTRSLLTHKVPVMQRRTKSGARVSINLNANPLNEETGIPAMVLACRRFAKLKDPRAWRLVMHPLAVGQTDASSKPAKRKSEKAAAAAPRTDKGRSMGCECALGAVLEKMSAQAKPKVIKVKRPTRGDPKYTTSLLGQRELLELILQKDKALAKASYARSTLTRSLSFIVGARRGRPSGATRASKEKGTER